MCVTLASPAVTVMCLSLARLEIELERDKRERDAREREMREHELREMEMCEKMKREAEMKPQGVCLLIELFQASTYP